MTGAISQLGLKVKQWDADEALEYAALLVDNLPLPVFVGSYLTKWFPNYRIILEGFIANSLIKYLSALPGDEIDVKNLIAPEYYDEVQSAPEPSSRSPENLEIDLAECEEQRAILQDLNQDLALENKELQETEADLRDHIDTLKRLPPGQETDPAPPVSGQYQILLAQVRSAFRYIEERRERIWRPYKDNPNSAPDSLRGRYIGYRESNEIYQERVTDDLSL